MRAYLCAGSLMDEAIVHIQPRDRERERRVSDGRQRSQTGALDTNVSGQKRFRRTTTTTKKKRVSVATQVLKGPKLVFSDVQELAREDTKATAQTNEGRLRLSELYIKQPARGRFLSV